MFPYLKSYRIGTVLFPRIIPWIYPRTRFHFSSEYLHKRVRRQDDARDRDNVARFHRPVPVIRCALLHRGAHLLCHVLCGGTVGGPLSLAIPSCLLLLDLRVLVVDCFLPVPRSTSTCARPSIPFRCGPAQCMCMCVSALCESVCMYHGARDQRHGGLRSAHELVAAWLPTASGLLRPATLTR